MPYKDPARQKAAQAKHYQAHKDEYRVRDGAGLNRRLDWVARIKVERGCCKCPERHPACLDFHHRTPEEKTLGVSEMVRRRFTMATILKEIEKCDVICSNCHRKMHWKDNKIFRKAMALHEALV